MKEVINFKEGEVIMVRGDDNGEWFPVIFEGVNHTGYVLGKYRGAYGFARKLNEEEKGE